MPAGGLAVLRIQLVPMSGFCRSATLQVNCPLGKVPDDHQVEGIRLLFDHGPAQFDEEIGGHALFLLARPRAHRRCESRCSSGQSRTGAPRGPAVIEKQSGRGTPACAEADPASTLVRGVLLRKLGVTACQNSPT